MGGQKRNSTGIAPIPASGNNARHSRIRRPPRKAFRLRFIPEFLLANHDFPLQGEFIELNVLLKLLGLAASGGAAKALIAEGAVRVDRQVETRIRRKLHAGDVVKLGDETIRIIANGIEPR